MKEIEHLFDTSAVIDMMRRKEYERGAISVITMIEILRGIDEEKRNRIKELLEESFEVVGIEDQVILTYCNIYNELKNEGKMIPDADLLIASSALTYDLTLKSGDEDFERVEDHGLGLEKY